MEDIFLTFSRSLPAATLLMLMVLLVTGSKSSAVRRHQMLGWGLALACVVPLIDPHLPQWRILPRFDPLPGEAWQPIHFPWFLTLAAIWFLGMAWMTARLVIGLGRLHWHQRVAIPVDDEDMLAAIQRCCQRAGLRTAPSVFLQPDYDMPMTWGWLKPRIWLPLSAEDWSREELECVLLHEMAHIERADFPGEIINRVCVAIYWFHPVAWLLARRLDLAREMACDDQVLLSGKPAGNYAESLASIGAGLPLALPESAAGFLGRKPLISRMIGIADPWRTRSRLTGEDVMATAAPVTLAMLFACSLGFKAAAEIHADRAQPADSQPEFPVVSVWDDLLLPTARALELTPQNSETENSANQTKPSSIRPQFQRAQITPEVAVPSPPPKQDLPSEPILLAKLNLPAPQSIALPPLDSIPAQSAPVQAIFLGYARSDSQPQTPAPTTEASSSPTEGETPQSKQSVSLPDAKQSTSAKDGSKTLSGDSSIPSAKNDADAETKTAKAAPTASQPRPRRELGAKMISDNGIRSMSVDCLVAKGTSIKLLRAEISHDLKSWKLIPDAQIIASEPVDAENDRLTLRIAAASGNGFIRLRQSALNAPVPEKSLPSKNSSKTSPNTLGRKSRLNLSIGRKKHF